MFNYPVYASDYLDMSGYGGHGSVGGIVSHDGKITMGYKWGFTYAQAEKVAKYLNKKQPKPELMMRLREKYGK